MCFGGGDPPPPVKQDPVADAKKAADDAAVRSNADASMRIARKRSMSLLASSVAGAAGRPDVYTPQTKAKLGA